MIDLKLDKNFPDHELAWLKMQVAGMCSENARKAFFLSFSMVSRKIAQTKLVSQPFKIAADDKFFGEFDTHDLGRFYLISQFSLNQQDSVALQKIYETASVPELISLNKLMYWIDSLEDKLFRCGEGLRSNVQSVFESIAHNNPFSFYELDESAWNQLVLKSLFIGSSIYKIYKLDERLNKHLNEMVVDYIRERTVANREVSVEIWRLVGGLKDPAFEINFSKMRNSNNSLEQMALALYLQEHKPQDLSQDLSECIKLCPNWNTLGQKLEMFNRGK